MTRMRIKHIIAALVIAALAWAPIAESTLYIDIVKSPRRLPIAVADLAGLYGQEISKIIREDLEASGVFDPLNPRGFIENPSVAFDPANWSGTGAEAVVKGHVDPGAELGVTVRLYDVVDAKPLMEKQYRAGRAVIRPLAHSIANDIYRHITGQDGIFRSKVLYIVRETDGGFTLNIADWDGERVQSYRLQANLLMSARWSPDSGRVVYSAERGRRWSIYMLDLTTMKETEAVRLAGTTIAGDFTPDGGAFLLSSTKEGTSDIYSFDLRAGTARRITKAFGIEVSPSASPDGKSIAYVSDRSGTPQIYTMDYMGYNNTRVTYEGNYNTSPSWSPTGELIAFSGRADGGNQIFVVRPDGSGLTKLTSKGNNEEPSFSPDGRQIVFTSERDGYKAVYVMRVDGQAQKRISPRGKVAYSPRWSPK